MADVDRGAAYSLFMEHERGTLAVGAAADLVVLSADPLTTPPDTWDKDLAVELTVVGGTIEYTRPAAPTAGSDRGRKSLIIQLLK